MVSASIKQKGIFKVPFEIFVVVTKGPKCVFEVLMVTSIWRKILLEWYCVISNIEFHIESKITYIWKPSSHEKQNTKVYGFRNKICSASPSILGCKLYLFFLSCHVAAEAFQFYTNYVVYLPYVGRFRNCEWEAWNCLAVRFFRWYEVK
jgi:hypothetical protein